MFRNGGVYSYDIPADVKEGQIRELNKLVSDERHEILDFLHRDQIGIDQSFLGPFGGRKIGKF